MGKAPAFQFYIKDWLSDPDLQSASSSSRGIWINALCYMWESVTRGKISGSIEELSKLLGASNGDFNGFLTDLERHKFADVTICNNEVTLINRRMYREQIDRENTRLRVARHRSNAVSNTNVTLPSSSSSPSPLKNKEKIKHIAKHEASPDVKPFIDFYFQEFKSHFSKEPVIQGGKDGSIAKELLRKIPLPELQGLLCSFFESDDQFIQQSGYTLGVFKSQINKLRIGTQKQSGLRAWAKEIIEEEKDGSGQKAVPGITETIGTKLRQTIHQGKS